MKRLAICIGLTRVDPAAYDGWDGECPGCDRDVDPLAAGQPTPTPPVKPAAPGG